MGRLIKIFFLRGVILLLGLSLISQALIAQNSITLDSISAAKYFDLGIKYNQNGKLDSSNLYLIKAIPYLKRQGDTLKHSKALLWIGYNYLDLGNYDQAISYFKEGLRYSILVNEGRNNIASNAYNALGEYYDQLSRYDSAIYYKKINLELSIKLYDSLDSKVASSYANLGGSYVFNDDFENAVRFLEKSLEINIANNDEIGLAQSYYSLGIAHTKLNNNNIALQMKLKALEIDLAAYGEVHQYVADDYASISITYTNMYRYKDAISYQIKALDLRKQIFGENHLNTALSLSNIGTIYNLMGELEKGLDFKKQSRNIMSLSLGEDHPRVIGIDHNIAVSYLELGKLDSALSISKKTLKKFEEKFNTPKIITAQHHILLGMIFKARSDYPEAIDHYSTAIDIYHKIFDEGGSYLASSYLGLGYVYEEMGDIGKALEFIQQSLNVNNYSYTDKNKLSMPPVDGYIDGGTYYESVLMKASLLRRDTSVAQQERLLLSLNILKNAADIYNNLSVKFKSEEDKLRLSEKIRFQTFEALQVNSELYQITHDKRFLEESFLFLQLSKAGVLRKAMEDLNAKSYAGIPDVLIQRESLVKQRIFNLEQMVMGLDEKENLEIENLRNELFKENLTLDSIVTKYELEFPDYYKLKYESNLISSEELRSFLRKECGQTAIIEYFKSNENLYILIVLGQGLHLISLPVDDLEKSLIGLRNSLIFRNDHTFDSLSRNSYRKLWKPVEEYLNQKKEEVNNIIIISDGLMRYIPFEVLKNDSGKYLIERYNMTYAISSAFITHNESSDISTKSFFGFAPVAFNNIGNLEGTEAEVKSISDLFADRDLRTETYFYARANPDLFETNKLKDFDVLHIATHGFIDDKFPNLSGFMTSISSDGNDSIIYVGDILNLKINASLSVLSACETGLGKRVDGEGILGLARSFIFAGSKNLVVSLWKVADNSTAILMHTFYKKLLKEGNYSSAIRHAKMAMINSSKFSQPYYWAPFILIGQ